MTSKNGSESVTLVSEEDMRISFNCRLKKKSKCDKTSPDQIDSWG